MLDPKLYTKTCVRLKEFNFAFECSSEGKNCMYRVTCQICYKQLKKLGINAFYPTV